MNQYEKCNHCGEWIDTASERHVVGYAGLVNRVKVYLHHDWCSEVYESSHSLSDRQVNNRFGASQK